MSTKKIQVNSALFRTSSRTKRNRKSAAVGGGGGGGDSGSGGGDTSASTETPMVSSARIRSELMKRFKSNLNARFGGQRKKGMVGDEMAAGGSGSRKKELDKEEDDAAENGGNDDEDEFQGAMQYMSQLRQQQSRAVSSSHKRTQRAPIGGGGATPTPMPLLSQQFPFVMTELAPALQPRHMPAVPPAPTAWSSSLNPGDDVPYGCLKGGSKKTYRAWKEGILNEEAANPFAPFRRDSVNPYHACNPTSGVTTHERVKARPPTPPKMTSNPDLRLGLGGERNLNATTTTTSQPDVRMMVDDDTDDTNAIVQKRQDADLELERLHMKRRSQSQKPQHAESATETAAAPAPAQQPRRTLKQTMRRKFTLGRFNKQKKVAVLIKDKQTQKKILHTQRTLKKTPMSDVRRYLRQHGMVKIGSSCPPDILRKTFESAMLAGEITNTNHNTLLHNLIHMDKVVNSGSGGDAE